MIHKIVSAYAWYKLLTWLFGIESWFRPEIMEACAYGAGAIISLVIWQLSKPFFNAQKPTRFDKVVSIPHKMLLLRTIYYLIGMGMCLQYEAFPEGSVERDRRPIVNHFVIPQHNEVSKKGMAVLEKIKTDIQKQGGDIKPLADTINDLIGNYRLFKRYKITKEAFYEIDKIWTCYALEAANGNLKRNKITIQDPKDKKEVGFFVEEVVEPEKDVQRDLPVPSNEDNHVSQQPHPTPIVIHNLQPHAQKGAADQKWLKTIIYATIAIAVIIVGIAYYLITLDSPSKNIGTKKDATNADETENQKKQANYNDKKKGVNVLQKGNGGDISGEDAVDPPKEDNANPDEIGDDQKLAHNDDKGQQVPEINVSNEDETIPDEDQQANNNDKEEDEQDEDAQTPKINVSKKVSQPVEDADFGHENEKPQLINNLADSMDAVANGLAGVNEFSSALIQVAGNIEDWLEKIDREEKRKQYAHAEQLSRYIAKLGRTQLIHGWCKGNNIPLDSVEKELINLMAAYFGHTNEESAIKEFHNAATMGNEVFLAYILQAYPMLKNEKSKYGYTALIFSAYHGHLDCVEYLVKQGADIHAKTQDENTALSYAQQKYEKYLADSDTNTQDGNTALSDAQNKHKAIADYLLEVKKELAEWFQEARNGTLSDVSKLDHININATDMKGLTALMLSAYGGHLACVKYLHEKGADINTKDKGNYTALMWSAQEGHLKCVEYLVEQGADIDAKDEDGETALMKSAINGKLKCVQYLVEQGANIHATDEDEYTALYYGQRHQAIKSYLEGQGASVKGSNSKHLIVPQARVATRPLAKKQLYLLPRPLLWIKSIKMWLRSWVSVKKKLPSLGSKES